MSGLRERLLVGAGLALVAAVFAWLNGDVRVAVNLGLVKIDAAPLPVVVFAAFLLGMLTLFLASLKADLRMQRMLRRYREALGREAATPRRATEVDPAGDRAGDGPGDRPGDRTADPAADET